MASPIIVVTLAFKAVAFLTKRLAQWFEPRFLFPLQLAEYQPAVGWKPKPNMDTHALMDDVFYVTTDADGWRGRTTSVADADLLVFGDSYAFGFAIDDKHHFANLNPDVRIKAIGANGYNMVQELLCMRELSPHLHGKLVVWFVFLGNDLLDNLEPSMLHLRSPFVREVDGTVEWEIVTRHVTAARWPFVSLRFRQVNYDRLTKVFSPTFVSRRAFGACEYLIGQGAEVCQRAGARLIVMTIPDPLQLTQDGIELLCAHGADAKSFDPALGDKRIRTICDKLGLPFVAGKDHLAAGDYREHDDHWNEGGHRRVADLLCRLHEQYAMGKPRRMVEQEVSHELDMRPSA